MDQQVLSRVPNGWSRRSALSQRSVAELDQRKGYAGTEKLPEIESQWLELGILQKKSIQCLDGTKNVKGPSRTKRE